MAKKRKIPKLTPEERARFEETTRLVRARIAERERTEVEMAARAQARRSA